MSRTWRARLGMIVAAALGLACLLLGGQDWYRQPAGATRAYAGDDLTGGLTRNLGFAALATVALMLVFGPLGRRVLAVLLAALGAGMLWLGLNPPSPALAVGDDEMTAPGRRATTAAALTGVTWLYAACAALTIAAAVWLLVSPGGRREPRPAGVAPGTPRTATEQWRLLDRGVDPTEDL